MKSVPHKLECINENLTANTGLLHPMALMDHLGLASYIDAQMPPPGSNRGIPHSTYIQTLILMIHAGFFHLDNVKHLARDPVIHELMDTHLPTPQALGNWLHRMGNLPDIDVHLKAINTCLLRASCHTLKKVTVDIDAFEVVSHKKDAQYTYKKNQGYLPIGGHIAETDQVLAIDFRDGNVAPATDNLAFIQQCEQSLPEGMQIKRLRIDAAGYQKKVIRYCQENGIEFLIRARMCSSLREYITHIPENEWKTVHDDTGMSDRYQRCTRMDHTMNDVPTGFTLVVQRTPQIVQRELPFTGEKTREEMTRAEFTYRAIATNCDHLSDSQIVYQYNQRGETSENRIKEFKSDCGGDTLPCSDFYANALYMKIVALAYNLYALLRDLSPEVIGRRRIRSIRPLLYHVPAKIVRSGRQLIVKLMREHLQTFEKVRAAIYMLRSPPVNSPA